MSPPRGKACPHEPRHRRPAVRADPGGEGVADVGFLVLVHGAGRAAGHPADHGLGRAARAAGPAGGGRPRRARGQPAGDLFPDGVGGRVDLEPGPAAPDRGGAGPRGPRVQPVGDPRAGDQHEALAAVRAQLRVLLRGPVPGRGAGGRDRRRHPVRRGRHLGEALRGQQPGDRPAPRRRPGRRADAAGDLLPGVRADRHGLPAVDDHVLLQQGERAVGVGEPVAAHDGAARGVRVRGAGGVGLGCGLPPRPRGEGRARPGDAAEPAAQPGPGRRGRPRRRAGRAGPRRPGPHRPGVGGQGHGRPRAGRGLRRRRPPPPRPGRRRGVGGAAEERAREVRHCHSAARAGRAGSP